MRLRLYLLALLIIVITAGCSEKKIEVTAVSPQSSVIIQKDNFVNQYRDWTRRLEKIAERTDKVYGEWEAKKIDTKTLKDEIDVIYKDMNELRLQTNLKAKFNLSEEDKKALNYDTIFNLYYRTSKSMNDFLFELPHYSDQQIKDKYNEMIKTNYKKDNAELKTILGL